MMKKLIITILLIIFTYCIVSEELASLYDSGNVLALKEKIYEKDSLLVEQIPRAAYYESLVTDIGFEEELKKIIDKFPDIEYADKINLKLAIINFYKRNYSQSEFYFDKISEKDAISDYYYWMARLYFMKMEYNRSSEAVKNYLSRCDKNNHKYELSYYMLIENNIRKGDYQKAIVIVTELINNKKENLKLSFLYYTIGKSYEHLDKIKDAVDYYKKSFLSEPYGQYASLSEERILELKKVEDKSIDISFLYQKDSDNSLKNDLIKTTERRSFNLCEKIRTDTITVFEKYLVREKRDSVKLVDTMKPIYEKLKNKAKEAELPLTDSLIVSRIERTPVKVDTEKADSNEVKLIERPTNIQTELYVELEQMPSTGYFIQIGRYSTRERARRSVEELFPVDDASWLIIKNQKNGKETFLVWCGAFDDEVKARRMIVVLRRRGMDCFLINKN